MLDLNCTREILKKIKKYAKYLRKNQAVSIYFELEICRDRWVDVLSSSTIEPI